MSSQGRKSNDPVVGRILSQVELEARRSTAARRTRLVAAMVAVVVVMGVVAVSFGVFSDHVVAKSSLTDVQVSDAVQPTRRSVPSNIAMEDIAKWVPVRLPSGRTELAPWATVNAEWLQDGETLKVVMARSSDVRAGNDVRHWPVKPLADDKKPL